MKNGMIKALICKMAVKSAKTAAGSASSSGFHQRKEPAALKKIKK